MSISVVTTATGERTIILAGTYTLTEVEQALRGLPPSRQPLVLDWRTGAVDHNAPELERLANLLAGVTPELTVMTGDILHYAFGRALMGYCSAKGVTVEIQQHNP